MKRRLCILALLTCLLGFTSWSVAKADAGGACLGQWSECREQCYSTINILLGIVQQCYAECDEQRAYCLGQIN